MLMYLLYHNLYVNFITACKIRLIDVVNKVSIQRNWLSMCDEVPVTMLRIQKHLNLWHFLASRTQKDPIRSSDTLWIIIGAIIATTIGLFHRTHLEIELFNNRKMIARSSILHMTSELETIVNSEKCSRLFKIDIRRFQLFQYLTEWCLNIRKSYVKIVKFWKRTFTVFGEI